MRETQNTAAHQIINESNFEKKLHLLKQYLQGHLSDGLVVIIGSGLSCAEGLPGMGELATFLKEHLPPVLCGKEQIIWEQISRILDSDGLEAALLRYPPSEALEAAIVDATTKCILPKEKKIIADAISGAKTLRFTMLLSHLFRPSGAQTGIPIVTTNYDRLIELGAELSCFGVDTLFIGNYAGAIDKNSFWSFCKGASQIRNKTVKNHLRDRILLCKVHGSFDWYSGVKDNMPIRHFGDLDLPRLIITPGLNKYRHGYNSPFDKHRERANDAISRATKFLVIGYGFNDDHLETYLRPRIKQGIPTVLLTYAASDKARELIEDPGSNFVALQSWVKEKEEAGTTLVTKAGNVNFLGSQMWDVSGFISEVFQK